MGSGKKQTIGYKYYMGMHMVLCHGPVDKISRIVVGDREAWTGNVTSNTTISIDQPNLFGGEQKEGGIAGNVDIMMGGPTQTANSYLVSQLGSVIPAFRGVVSAVLNKCYVAAMSPYPKAWAWEITKNHGEWYAAKSNIGSGSANAAHIIYSVLTNTDWGMGQSPSVIDTASFTAVADALYTEGLGLSFILSQPDDIKSFIYAVLTHVNGIFYTRPTDGKFALKLLRADYTVGSLPVLNESNILSLTAFERPVPAEMVNELVVVYRPRGTDKDDSVTVQDLAGIQFQEGVVSQTVNYPGIDNAANAGKVALRDLRVKTTPLAKVSLKVNRTAFNLSPGDCFKFSWTELGIVELVVRILKIDYGDFTNGEISIDGVQDVFSLPAQVYLGNQTSNWTNPVQAPTDLTSKTVFEAPYWEIARNIDSANFALYDNTSAFLAALGAQPVQAAINYEFWTQPSGGSYNLADTAPFALHALLNGAITVTQTSLTMDTFRGDFTTMIVGGWILIDNEIMRIDSINTTSGAAVVGRGCLDTVPVPHSDNAVVYFATDHIAIDETEHAIGENVTGKLLMRTGNGLLALGSTTGTLVTFAGRFGKPYAPGNLRINSLSYPAVPLSGTLTVTWAHRDRTQQLATILDHTAGNVGPEAGVTYSATLTNTTTSTIVASTTGVSGTTWVIGTVAASGNYLLEVWAVRSGTASHQKARHAFDYVSSGWGYSWGDDWGGTP